MTLSRILWGDGYELALNVAAPLDSIVTDRMPRQGYEVAAASSGVRDAWITDRDYTLEGDWRWISEYPASTGQPRTALAESAGWMDFMQYARDMQPFRFVPDITAPDFYADGCTLVEPLRGLGGLEPNADRRIRLKIRNPVQDLGAMFRGLFLDYAPGGGQGRFGLTRASVADYTGQVNAVSQAAAGILRDRHYQDTFRSTLLEQPSANLIRRSGTFGSTWTATNAPTRTAAQFTLDRLGFELIGDTDAALNAFYSDTITFTGDAVKAASIYLARGVTPAASGSRVEIEDTTSAAMRLQLTITWNADGTPNVINMLTGTNLRAEFVGWGVGAASGVVRRVYRLRLRTTSVTASHAHTIRVFPASLNTDTGDVYATGVQVEDNSFPTSHIETTGAAGVVRNRDQWLFSAWTWKPQAMWLYASFVEDGLFYNTSENGNSPGVIQIGHSAADTGQRVALYAPNGAGSYRFFNGDSVAADVLSELSHTHALGDRVELLALLFPDGSVQIKKSINGAADVAGSVSAAHALGPAWATAAVSIGWRANGGAASLPLRRLKLGVGNQVNVMALARVI